MSRESGDRRASQRAAHGKPWSQMALTAAQAERTQDGLSILRCAEDLLVSGRYHTKPSAL